MRNKDILLSLLIFLLASAIALGVGNMAGKWQGSSAALGLTEDLTVDANALEMFVYNDGNFAYDNIGVYNKTDGLYFPRGTKKTVIYAAGLWLGAAVKGEYIIDTTIVKDTTVTPPTADTTIDTTQASRIAMAEYSSEFIPGPMVDGTFNPNWQDDQYRVYKINRGDMAATNRDYAEWPVVDGAPVDKDGNPAILGDQMLWSVYNDADPSRHENEAGNTEPLNVEVQQTTFAFARSGALGNCIFIKFKFINKGSDSLENMYVSLWADPDLGDAGDDLVGCDTFLSLGFCYNSGPDDIYGKAPPAVGFDFFQGPIVPGEPTDTAYVSGEPRPGYKNLPMTSFAKYINGEDPRSSDQTYDFMNGLRKNPATGTMEPAVDPGTGDTTNFVLAGDPVTGEGWLDTAPADRRYMMSSGPFDFNPNDTQEVVCAVLVGQGSNPLTSITELKRVDIAAQTVFDLNFDIPPPPPSPTIYARGGEGYIDLTWGTEPVGDIQINEILGQEFHFEGFNLYQGESEVGPWTKFATYDRNDDESWICDSVESEENPGEFDPVYCTGQKIYGDMVDPVAGGTQRVIIQKGSDSGLEFHLRIERDQITGEPVIPNRPYFMAVTAYSYDWANITEFADAGGNNLGIISEALESPIIPIEVRPLTHQGVFSDTADHVSGGSDGDVFIEYVDYDEIAGHDYEVTFNEDDTWNLQDLTDNYFPLTNQVGQTPGYVFPIVDGCMIRTQGPSLGVKSVSEIANGDSMLTAPDNVNYSYNSTGDWYMDPGGGHGLSRYNWWGENYTTHDYEIRFTEEDTEYCFDWFGYEDNYGQVNSFQVPIEFWDIGIGTPDDDSDDRRICFMLIDNDESGSFNWGDGLYLWDIAYDSVNWSDPTDNAGNYDPDYLSVHYGRWWFYGATEDIDRPAPGTIVRTLTNKVNTTEDVFRFSTQKVGAGDGTYLKLTLDNVKTFPNPYYAYYEEEVDQFDRTVYFINLPPADMKIRIFNLAGDLVRTMDVTKSELETYDKGGMYAWDLLTDGGLWVAPGIYVWLIEAEGLGSAYGKMAIFTEVEQLNNF